MKNITNDFILKHTLINIQQNSRMIDYYAILNVLNPHQFDQELLTELEKYQNFDGGFGKGLEPDVQMEQSSILATDLAMNYVALLDESIASTMIQKMVQYIENQFNEETLSFPIVDKNVELAPHAIWWNFETLDFPYANPNPEVIGFLYRYRKYVKKIDIDHLVKHMVNHIQTDFINDSSEHSLYSVLRFYEAMPIEIKEQIQPTIKSKIDSMTFDHNEWTNYVAQPLDVFSSPSFFLYQNYKELVDLNLDYRIQLLLDQEVLKPSWQWYQYEDTFELIKNQWNGFITLKTILVLKKYGRIQ